MCCGGRIFSRLAQICQSMSRINEYILRFYYSTTFILDFTSRSRLIDGPSRNSPDTQGVSSPDNHGTSPLHRIGIGFAPRRPVRQPNEAPWQQATLRKHGRSPGLDTPPLLECAHEQNSCSCRSASPRAARDFREAGVDQPRVVGEGAPCCAHDRAGREARRHWPRHSHHRVVVGKHGHCHCHGGGHEGLHVQAGRRREDAPGQVRDTKLERARSRPAAAPPRTTRAPLPPFWKLTSSSRILSSAARVHTGSTCSAHSAPTSSSSATRPSRPTSRT